MDERKEKWIDEVLQSAKGIQPAEISPGNVSRIEAKLQEPYARIISLKWVFASAAAILLLLFLNISVWQNSKEHVKDSSLQQLIHENGWSNNDYYSLNESK